ncbi:MAG: PucR family transcriptional regulator [Nocardioides sp.]
MAAEPAKAPAGLNLSPAALQAMQDVLGSVSNDVIAAIITDVPSYSDALSGPMGQTIRNAVQVALSGFLNLAAASSPDELTPKRPALEGAYELGRGEARSGRTPEALLAAYRIGAKVAWAELGRVAVQTGVSPAGVAEYAGLVFSYIDELSASSAAGHRDETNTTGRVRSRLLERLARHLVTGASAEIVDEAVAQAEWPVPISLTAVLAPAELSWSVEAAAPASTLVLPDLGELEGTIVLLVPDVHGRRRAALLSGLRERRVVVGPAKPWREARLSYVRALRGYASGLRDTDEHLVEMVLGADTDALADLRSSVLAPLANLRPATADKLAETLRSWLLHQGRREEVAAELFVHPQTVRYRMQQLRELFGDGLDDPQMVLALTVALA